MQLRPPKLHNSCIFFPFMIMPRSGQELARVFSLRTREPSFSEQTFLLKHQTENKNIWGYYSHAVS